MRDLTKIIIPLDGLKKVRGFSFEDIQGVINSENIRYRVKIEPGLTDKRYGSRLYFRDSRIQVLGRESVGKLYGHEQLRPRTWGTDGRVIRGDSFWIRAYYELLPAFDLRQLDGPVVFDHGYFVEKTEIQAVPERVFRLV